MPDNAFDILSGFRRPADLHQDWNSRAMRAHFLMCHGFAPVKGSYAAFNRLDKGGVILYRAGDGIMYHRFCFLAGALGRDPRFPVNA